MKLMNFKRYFKKQKSINKLTVNDELYLAIMLRIS